MSPFHYLDGPKVEKSAGLRIGKPGHEPGWRAICQRQVGPKLIVVAPPGSERLGSLLQGPEPGSVEPLVRQATARPEGRFHPPDARPQSLTLS